MEYIKQPLNLKSKRTIAAIIGTVLLFIALPLTVIGVLQLREGTPKLTSRAAAPPLDQTPFPRISNVNSVETKDLKYQVVSIGGCDAASKIETLRNKTSGSPNYNPIGVLRYFSGRAYQGEDLSMPFNDTYPGHWLFYAGTTTTQPLNASEDTSTVTVDNVDAISAYTGTASPLPETDQEYVMIWDGETSGKTDPNESLFWGHAEHALVTGVSVSDKTLTLERGGHPNKNDWSPIAHARGSRIAIHVGGAGVASKTVWSYNQSLAAPINADTGNKQFNQIMGEWLGANLNNCTPSGDLYDGVLFDVTPYWFSPTGPGRKADMDNDNQADAGIFNGVSSWGEGLDFMFQTARVGLDNLYPLSKKIMTGGVIETRGFDSLNGTQFEGFPGNIDINEMDGDFARYESWMEKAVASPKYTELFARFKTNLYHDVSPGGNPCEADTTTDQKQNPFDGTNKAFRYTLGMTMLGDGFYIYNAGRGCFGDYWWDEYAVDDNGVGQAAENEHCDTLSTQAEKIACWQGVKGKTGYLGKPKGDGKYQRLFNKADHTALITNFLDLGNWSKTRAKLSVITDSDASRDQVIDINPTDSAAAATYGSVDLGPSQDYTLNFWAKADSIHDITVQVLDGATVLKEDDLLLFPAWKEYYIVFKSPADPTSAQIKFNLLDETSDVFIDDLQVYTGGANKFRRDFDNGIVLVNGNSTPATFTLEKPFKRIINTLTDDKKDDVDRANDGSVVTSTIIVPDHDAIILLNAKGKIGDIEPVGGDGDVDIHDLSTLISNWGPNGGIADLNGDSKVDVYDLSILLKNWGP